MDLDKMKLEEVIEGQNYSHMREKHRQSMDNYKQPIKP